MSMNQPRPYPLSLQQTHCSNSLPDLSYSFFPTTPISPPAPHRKAPSPPTYSPRRNRARHINMKEPAQLGLFTVSESEEELYIPHKMAEPKLNSMYNLPSAVPSSEVFPSPSPSPSPRSRSNDGYRRSPMNVPRGIDEDMEMDEKLNRLSWSSKGSLISTATLTEGETDTEGLISTPLSESEDPFGWSTGISFSSDSFELDVEMTEDTIGGNLFTPSYPHKQPTIAESIKSGHSRRPPPLTLTTRFLTPIATPTSAKSNLFSAISNASTAESDLILTPRTATSPSPGSLLPALPIVSSIEWASKVYSSSPEIVSPITPTRPKRHGYTAIRSKSSKRKSPDDPIDLAMALEDLLTSCGEKFDSSSDSEFSGPTSITGSSSSYCSTSESESECESELNGFESRSLRFPLPPNRTPIHHHLNPKTPSPIRKNFNNRPLTPYAPKKDRRNVRSNSNSDSPSTLKGDHSFLISLSMGENESKNLNSSTSSSSSSVGSNSSRKSLPGRKALPTEWMRI